MRFDFGQTDINVEANSHFS